jgi:hypothetical protein
LAVADKVGDYEALMMLLERKRDSSIHIVEDVD